MNEVRLFGGLLAVLLVAAYLSWTHEDEGADTSEVALWSIQPSQLERLELVTTTQTVAFSRTDADEQDYGWFEVTRRDKKTTFVGNDAVEKLVESFAPLTALRSLGRSLEGEALTRTGLDNPKRKLTVVADGTSRVYDVGERTHGARDHYVRPQTSKEVFLLAARTLGDLEFPQSKFMQRSLLVKPLTEVEAAVLSANGKTLSVVHTNRGAPADAFWATEGEERPNEVVGSFMLKLSRLTITEYPENLAAFEAAQPVLEIVWKDEDGQSMGTTALFRTGRDADDPKATYFAKSDRTVRPGLVSKTTAARLEKDLSSVLP